jgi:O-acetyl-ADP-ribose deacetylase (regulator of RNase III)
VLIEVIAGDITRLQVDAIVNAANATLLGGGGVDGAIHAAAGPRLLEECRRLRRTTHRDGLPVGQAVVTGGHDLPARWVVHTVGPNRHRGQTDPALLTSCFVESLRAAARVGATSVAFPAIGAGAFGWDVEDVARIAVAAVRGAGPDDIVGAVGAVGSIERVVFVPFGPRAMQAFVAALAT